MANININRKMAKKTKIVKNSQGASPSKVKVITPPKAVVTGKVSVPTVKKSVSTVKSKQVSMSANKIIKNVSLQGLELFINSGKGPEAIWLEPRKSFRLKENEITSQILTLEKRRLLRITSV